MAGLPFGGAPLGMGAETLNTKYGEYLLYLLLYEFIATLPYLDVQNTVYKYKSFISQ